MSNFSKEKVLEWVNSSEARAAKYEQEAKVTQQYDHNNCRGRFFHNIPIQITD